MRNLREEEGCRCVCVCGGGPPTAIVSPIAKSALHVKAGTCGEAWGKKRSENEGT